VRVNSRVGLKSELTVPFGSFQSSEQLYRRLCREHLVVDRPL